MRHDARRRDLIRIPRTVPDPFGLSFSGRRGGEARLRGECLSRGCSPSRVRRDMSREPAQGPVPCAADAAARVRIIHSFQSLSAATTSGAPWSISRPPIPAFPKWISRFLWRDSAAGGFAEPRHGRGQCGRPFRDRFRTGPGGRIASTELQSPASSPQVGATSQTSSRSWILPPFPPDVRTCRIAGAVG